jgi:hypothetical protein
MNKFTYTEIELFVTDYVSECSPASILELYNKITDKNLTMEDLSIED